MAQFGPGDPCHANFLKGDLVIACNLLDGLLLRWRSRVAVIDPKRTNSVVFCKIIAEASCRVQSTGGQHCNHSFCHNPSLFALCSAAFRSFLKIWACAIASSKALWVA